MSEENTPVSVNSVPAEQLRSIIERIEHLENRKAEVSEDIKLVKQEAKSEGFDVKIINKILKLRKSETRTLQEEELLTAIYLRALGMVDPRDSSIEG